MTWKLLMLTTVKIKLPHYFVLSVVLTYVMEKKLAKSLAWLHGLAWKLFSPKLVLIINETEKSNNLQSPPNWQSSKIFWPPRFRNKRKCFGLQSVSLYCKLIFWFALICHEIKLYVTWLQGHFITQRFCHWHNWHTVHEIFSIRVWRCRAMVV